MCREHVDLTRNHSVGCVKNLVSLLRSIPTSDVPTSREVARLREAYVLLFGRALSSLPFCRSLLRFFDPSLSVLKEVTEFRLSC